MTSSDFRRHARFALKGHWPNAMISGFIATILSGVYNLSIVQKINWLEIRLDYRDWFTIFHLGRSMSSPYDLSPFVKMLGILSVITMIFAGLIKLGYAAYNINLIDRHPAKTSDLISYWRYFGKAWFLWFATTILITLWTILLVIPGIIVAYRYRMAQYLMAENPELTALGAIRLSGNLMRGRKMNLFLLDLSFIGWLLLSAASFGLGFIVLGPYMACAEAAFYHELSGRSQWQNPNSQF